MASPFSPRLNRRDFLRRSFAFSALATMAPSAFDNTLLGQSALGRNESPAPDGANPHMLMVGDWGTDHYVLQQQAVANAMKSWVDSRKIKPEALFMLGDNWYGNMGTGLDSSRWQSQFEQMYPSSYFPGPAYVVLGNHDYEYKVANKADLQLGYARKGKTRWTLPAKWYSFKWPEQNPIVTFICLDSNLPGTKKDPWPWSFTMTKNHMEDQNQWFAQELAKPLTTPFRAVIAHHPLYTNGVHKDQKVLIDAWDALIRQHKVHFWISGHDHDMQHLEFNGHPTSFVISGGGGAELVDWTIAPEKRGPYGGKVLGFTDVEFNAAAITLRHYDQNARELHAFRKTPDGKVELFIPKTG